MKYIVRRTDLANEDLLSAINYIADDTKSTATAINYLDKLKEAIMKLSEFPEMGVKPRYTSLRLQGFRVLIIESHLVFYKIIKDKQEIMIYRIFHGNQDYINLI